MLNANLCLLEYNAANRAAYAAADRNDLDALLVADRARGYWHARGIEARTFERRALVWSFGAVVALQAAAFYGAAWIAL